MDVINERLRRKASQQYYYYTTMSGFKQLGNPVKLIQFIIIVLFVAIIGSAILDVAPVAPVNMTAVFAAVYMILIAITILCAAYVVGRVPGGRKLYDNLIRVGYVNNAYEAPIPISIVKSGNSGIAITFWGKGFPFAMWAETNNLAKVATALGMEILDLRPGRSNQEVVVYGVRSKCAMPDNIEWHPERLPQSITTVALGEYPAGQILLDFAKVPHVLLGAATGMGKTVLLKLIVLQLLMHKWYVHISDRKGLIDYSTYYRNNATISETDDELLEEINHFRQKMSIRKETLLSADCPNINEYNANSDTPMQHCALVVDEASMVMDSTGLDSASKKKKQEIIAGLTEIGRLGRAYGMHLIVCTQRPSVDSVPGSLKAQLDGRIAGHMADVATSEVIMDDGSAARLPAIPGRFLLRDAGGLDKTFQAYNLTYLD